MYLLLIEQYEIFLFSFVSSISGNFPIQLRCFFYYIQEYEDTESSYSMIRVLVVDDHAIVRQGYVKLISSFPDMQVCSEADSGEKGYMYFLQYRPDVVITDLSMHGISGMTLLQKILVRDKNAKIVICSMYDNQTLITTALQLGAKGFVSKSSDPLNIIKAIQSVIKGQNYLSDDLRISNEKTDIPSEIQKIQLLKTKELEIFKMLAEGKSITACADILNISDKTANNYQTSLRNKLGVVNSAELVHIALRHGIIKSYL